MLLKIMIAQETLEEIVQFIDNNDTVYLIASTGSGKTTNIPPAIAEAHPKAVIMVGVPTITAAITISKMVKYQNPDISVEYAAGGEVTYKKGTRIVYATYGHIRNKLKNYFEDGRARPIKDIDYLIIDEAHTKQIDADMIEAMWNQTDQKVKLILMSGTPQKNIKIPVFTVQNKPYRVKVEYTKEKVDNKRPDIEAIKNEVIKQHKRLKNASGGILIFLPGTSEIMDLKDLFDEDDHEDMNILTAYGNMAKDDIDKIFEPDVPGIRKVIIATNIAESAITIPNLLIVIDSMFERVLEVNDTGVNRLVLQRISKDAADQRKGRTGRIQRDIKITDANGNQSTYDGFLVRMISELDYFSLADSKVPEIQRITIDKEVLDIYSIGLDPKLVLSPFLGTPSMAETKINKSILTLKKIKAIENKSITELGEFVAGLPLDVRNGACLWFWIYALKQPAFPCMVLVSLIDAFGPSYFWYPMQEQDESDKEFRKRLEKISKIHSRFAGRDDLVTLLNLWITFVTETGKIDPGRPETIEWCQKNYINNKKLRECINILTIVFDRVRGSTAKVALGPFDPESVVDTYNQIAVEIFDTQVMTRTRKGTFTNKIEFFSMSQPKNSVPRTGPVESEKILAIGLFNKNITLYSSLDEIESGTETETESEMDTDDFFSDED